MNKSHAVALASITTVLAACFGSDGSSPSGNSTSIQSAQTRPDLYNAEGVQIGIARATCRDADKAESGLQGQVALADRLAGFGGYNHGR